MAPWNRKGLGFITGIWSASKKKAADAPVRSSQPIMGRFHHFLELPPQPQEWYRAMFRQEMAERREAKTTIDRLSESSDALYLLSRSHYEGYPVRALPPFRLSHILVYGYMIPKLTSRWMFYRVAAFLCGCPCVRDVREVVNPARDHKLVQVALRNNMNADTFLRVSHQLRRAWIFLP